MLIMKNAISTVISVWQKHLKITIIDILIWRSIHENTARKNRARIRPSQIRNARRVNTFLLVFAAVRGTQLTLFLTVIQLSSRRNPVRYSFLLTENLNQLKHCHSFGKYCWRRNCENLKAFKREQICGEKVKYNSYIEQSTRLQHYGWKITMKNISPRAPKLKMK